VLKERNNPPQTCPEHVSIVDKNQRTKPSGVAFDGRADHRQQRQQPMTAEMAGLAFKVCPVIETFGL
jgi:hypothetical protein